MVWEEKGDKGKIIQRKRRGKKPKFGLDREPSLYKLKVRKMN